MMQAGAAFIANKYSAIFFYRLAPKLLINHD